MQIDFAVLADYAMVDQAGKLSVLGIFRHIWVDSFPVVHPRSHLVIRVRGKRTEIGEHAMTIRLVDDLGQELLGGQGTVRFGEPPAGVREVEAAAVLVFDIPFPRPGEYRFEVALGQDPPVRVPVTVHQAGERK